MSALPPKADIGPHRDGIDAPGYSRDRNSEVATDRQCGEFFAAASKEHVADGHQPVCPQLVQGRKSPIEIAFGAGLQDMNLQAERAGGRLQTFQRVSVLEFVGLTSRAIILALGTASCSSSRSFGSTSTPKLVAPVILPPG